MGRTPYAPPPPAPDTVAQGARPSALHIVEPQRVERARDAVLVLGREIHAGGLLAVAQGGVEKGQRLAGHARSSRRVLSKPAPRSAVVPALVVCTIRPAASRAARMRSASA